MTPESQELRAAIRSGELSPDCCADSHCQHAKRLTWEHAIRTIYRLEEAAEQQGEMRRVLR